MGIVIKGRDLAHVSAAYTGLTGRTAIVKSRVLVIEIGDGAVGTDREAGRLPTIIGMLGPGQAAGRIHNLDSRSVSCFFRLGFSVVEQLLSLEEYFCLG